MIKKYTVDMFVEPDEYPGEINLIAVVFSPQGNIEAVRKWGSWRAFLEATKLSSRGLNDPMFGTFRIKYRGQ